MRCSTVTTSECRHSARDKVATPEPGRHAVSFHLFLFRFGFSNAMLVRSHFIWETSWKRVTNAPKIGEGRKMRYLRYPEDLFRI